MWVEMKGFEWIDSWKSLLFYTVFSAFCGFVGWVNSLPTFYGDKISGFGISDVSRGLSGHSLPLKTQFLLY